MKKINVPPPGVQRDAWLVQCCSLNSFLLVDLSFHWSSCFIDVVLSCIFSLMSQLKVSSTNYHTP